MRIFSILMFNSIAKFGLKIQSYFYSFVKFQTNSYWQNVDVSSLEEKSRSPDSVSTIEFVSDVDFRMFHISRLGSGGENCLCVENV